MLTLRNESSQPAAEGGSWAGGRGWPPAVDQELPLPVEPCPYCQQNLTIHRFITRDGLAILTYHCNAHGDVMLSRRVPTRDHP